MQRVFVENKYPALRGVEVNCMPWGSETLLLCCSVLLEQIDVAPCLEHRCCSVLYTHLYNFYLVVAPSCYVVGYVPGDSFKACPGHYSIYCGDDIRALEYQRLNLRVLSYRLLNVVAAGGGDVCRTVHIEPEQTDYGILMCFIIINSSSHQKIYIFASFFFATHEVMPGQWVIQVQATLFGVLTWRYGNFCHMLSQPVFCKVQLWSGISGGKNKQTIFQLKTTIFQSMANIWKHGSCLIPYGVRPETANSTHPKLLVFKQEKKINRKAVVWDFGAYLRVFPMLTRRRRWHTSSASEGRMIGTF